MRVLHVFRTPVGGLFRHVRDLARGQFESGRPAISNDGLVVAFESWSENWDPRDQNGWQDVYVYDAVSGIIECVSDRSRASSRLM